MLGSIVVLVVGVEAVNVDLVDAEPLVPIIQHEVQVLATPWPLVAAAGGILVMFPALIGHLTDGKVGRSTVTAVI